MRLSQPVTRFAVLALAVLLELGPLIGLAAVLGVSGHVEAKVTQAAETLTDRHLPSAVSGGAQNGALPSKAQTPESFRP